MSRPRCRHAKKIVRERAFRGPVVQRQKRAAHGCICIEETCPTCGATRSTNVNGQHRETTGWRVEEQDA